MDAGGVTVNAGGLFVNGGHTVTSGGVQITAGGATVVDGGLVVLDDGASIVQSAAAVPTLSLSASSASYLNTVLHVNAPNRGSSSQYNLLVAKEGSNVLMQLRVRRQRWRAGACGTAPHGSHLCVARCVPPPYPHRVTDTCSQTATSSLAMRMRI